MADGVSKLAWDTLSSVAPIPFQSLIAFVVVILLAIPLVMKARRALQPIENNEQQQPTLQQTPWLIVTLTNISVQQQGIDRKLDDIAKGVGELKGVVLALTSLLRKRQSRKP